MRATYLATALAAAAILWASAAPAADVFGIWQTEKTDDGRYLHVEVHPCAGDAGKVCGTIVGAFGGASEANVGKPVIWDMTPDGPNAWDDGKVWKADEDKVYASKMALEGEVLEVSGCVLAGMICKSQDWSRAQ
jgi:uncharacterized protein (DUF2147 family)